MNHDNRELRSPQERVGTLPNAALPPPDEEPPSVEALLRRALVDRDERALRVVTRLLHPEMIRIATFHVRSRDDAEDVVQDTWLAALRGIDRFEGRSSLHTWLRRILTYRARTAGARASRVVPISQLRGGDEPRRDASGDLPDGRPPAFSQPQRNPQDALLADELGEELERCLATLPPRQRDVLRLRDLEGRSAAHVCRTLELTPGNQRVLLHRARHHVRERLRGYLQYGWREANVA